jgi:hypothetical protein
MGVLFFVVNCVFAIVILLMCFYSSIRAIMSKNPDNRYQPMRDDRGSFIKSSQNLGHTELDALGATARGDTPYGMAETKRLSEFDDDSTSSTLAVGQQNATGQPGYNRSASPYQNVDGYQSPYQQRIQAQTFRSTNNSSPSPANNQWQRGVGY